MDKIYMLENAGLLWTGMGWSKEMGAAQTMSLTDAQHKIDQMKNDGLRAHIVTKKYSSLK